MMLVYTAGEGGGRIPASPTREKKKNAEKETQVQRKNTAVQNSYIRRSTPRGHRYLEDASSREEKKTATQSVTSQWPEKSRKVDTLR